MRVITLAIIAALVLAGCKQEQEIGPRAASVERDKLATQERMQQQMLEAIGGRSKETLEALQKSEAERRHLCWQEGHRNCSGLSGRYLHRRAGRLLLMVYDLTIGIRALRYSLFDETAGTVEQFTINNGWMLLSPKS
jgi:hypothetical protein